MGQSKKTYVPQYLSTKLHKYSWACRLPCLLKSPWPIDVWSAQTCEYRQRKYKTMQKQKKISWLFQALEIISCFWLFVFSGIWETYRGEMIRRASIFGNDWKSLAKVFQFSEIQVKKATHPRGPTFLVVKNI